MKNIKILSLIIINLAVVFFAFPKGAIADSGPLNTQTTFYFEKNGEPINEPIDFEIKCYGKSIFANGENDKLFEIYQLSEACLYYGCSFKTSLLFESRGKLLEYCDLKGNINGEKFTINNFYKPSNLTYSFVDYDIGKKGKYYKETKEYNECMGKVYDEFFPQRNGDVLGEFICDRELIPTTLSIEENGPCYRYGYEIKDGTCYKISQSFFDCTKRERDKMTECDKYLKDITEELARDEEGLIFERKCSMKIEIPDNSQANQEETETVTGEDNQDNSVMNFLRSLIQKILSLFS